MSKILLVEDEEMLSLILKDTLSVRDFEVAIAKDGKEAIHLFEEFNPSLIVLDIMLPKMNGYDVISHIRKINNTLPIIITSAKNLTGDVLKGFELGANDYLRKPFSIDELIARIKVLLKNTEGNVHKQNLFNIGKYDFDYAHQTLFYENDKIVISFKEAELLRYLAATPNQIVHKDLVLNELWGDNNVYNSRNMDVVITKIRSYLKNDPNVTILNIRGIGYKLIIEIE
jgi:two-component system, OmpR family, response regulator VicR